jgi:hypothetical protein
MALPRFVDNWTWAVPQSANDPDFDLHRSLITAGAMVSEYRQHRDKVAHEWQLNPDRPFDQQGAPRQIVDRATRVTCTTARAD